MLKKTTVLLATALSIILAVGCASKGKKGPGQDGSTENLKDDISSKPESFDAQGSDSGKITGLRTIHFDYDSATLSTEARKTLADNADWIKKNSGTIQVEGHCDDRGTSEYNLALGERRARAVKSYLNSMGVENKRMTVISYGEEKPLVPGESEDARSKNRRANFVPMGN